MQIHLYSIAEANLDNLQCIFAPFYYMRKQLSAQLVFFSFFFVMRHKMRPQFIRMNGSVVKIKSQFKVFGISITASNASIGFRIWFFRFSLTLLRFILKRCSFFVAHIVENYNSKIAIKSVTPN